MMVQSGSGAEHKSNNSFNVKDDHTPIEKTGDRGIGPPYTLIVPRGEEPAPADDTRRLIARLEYMGYGAYKEYSNKYQTVYTVQPYSDQRKRRWIVNTLTRVIGWLLGITYILMSFAISSVTGIQAAYLLIAMGVFGLIFIVCVEAMNLVGP